jgi:23S rRNA (uracil1939-C5)-methyltransferase
MKPTLSQIVELDITDMGISGEGIGSLDGFKVFVDGALPLEKVQISIETVKSNFAIGKLLKILTPSPHRVQPLCSVFDRCGGCQIMHLSYPEQLEVKRKRVKDALMRIGKVPLIDLPPVVASPCCLHYRNKIQLPVSGSQGKIKIGLYAKRSHKVVDIQQCWIHNSLGDSLFQKVSALIKKSDIVPYNDETGEGELRHLLMRSSLCFQKTLIVLITTSHVSPLLRKLAHELFSLEGIKGVIHHKNTREDNVILDQEFTTLYGDSFIEEKLCGLTFKVSAASFFQVNPLQAERLYNQAIEYAGITAESKVLDAYCGIGTLALVMAQKAKEVVGIECVPQAIKDAQENARINKIHNVRFICGQSERELSFLSGIDIVVVNPPRKGCDLKLLLELKRLSPKTIVYISCDPATLARDIHILRSYGFYHQESCAFDMFPQTMHVETVARFTREIQS